jgi:hypothetical protein
MGTRHLTIVRLDGEYRVAQYGQWDGYPQGQGATILEFLDSWNRPEFEAKVRTSSFITPDDAKAIDNEIKALPRGVDWQRKYPALTRDTGAKILRLIHDAEPGLKLKNSISFAGDSLFCEWAYVLDLDANTLEVFKGFNKEPLPQGERFASVPDLEKSDGYHPVRMVARYDLRFPVTIDRLVKDCDPKEEPAEASA